MCLIIPPVCPCSDVSSPSLHSKNVPGGNLLSRLLK